MLGTLEYINRTSRRANVCVHVCVFGAGRGHKQSRTLCLGCLVCNMSYIGFFSGQFIPLTYSHTDNVFGQVLSIITENTTKTTKQVG